MNIECSSGNWLSNEDYLRLFNENALRHRIPLSGSIDLTYRCNLRCIHCYVQGVPEQKGQSEMTTAEILNIIDEITEAGCLFLLITGGEPLLRNDFAEIYTHAKQKGLLITIFTNGTLITEKILDLFQDLPPYAVEITLYGSTATTYETITGVPDSYEKCMHGMQKLLNRKINLSLKTIVMTLNSNEFLEIEQIAKKFGVKFRFDAAIFPRMNGDRSPLSLRLSPDDIVQKDFSNPERYGLWKDYHLKYQKVAVSNDLYKCGAGLTGFHIDPNGNLKPCLMTFNMHNSLITRGFQSCWQDVLIAIKNKKSKDDFLCNRCEKRHLCGYCHPFFEMECNKGSGSSQYLCELGNQRFQRLDQMFKGVQNAL